MAGAVGLEVGVVADLEAAVVVVLEEEEEVEDVDSEVCFFSSLQQMCTCFSLRVNVLFFLFAGGR